MLITTSYIGPPKSWLLSPEWLTYSQHAVRPILHVSLVSAFRSTPNHISLKYTCPDYCDAGCRIIVHLRRLHDAATSGKTCPISFRPWNCTQLVQDFGDCGISNSVCCVNAAGISGSWLSVHTNHPSMAWLGTLASCIESTDASSWIYATTIMTWIKPWSFQSCQQSDIQVARNEFHND
jgi:hypothetical protein